MDVLFKTLITYNTAQTRTQMNSIIEVNKELKKSIYLSKINLFITVNKKLVKSQSLNVGFKSFFICILERRVLLLHKLHDVSWRASKIYQWCRKIKLLRKSILKKINRWSKMKLALHNTEYCVIIVDLRVQVNSRRLQGNSKSFSSLKV